MDQLEVLLYLVTLWLGAVTGFQYRYYRKDALFGAFLALLFVYFCCPLCVFLDKVNHKFEDQFK